MMVVTVQNRQGPIWSIFFMNPCGTKPSTFVMTLMRKAIASPLTRYLRGVGRRLKLKQEQPWVGKNAGT